MSVNPLYTALQAGALVPASCAVTAAVALVPAVAAEASVPRNPELSHLNPCVLKWIEAPTKQSVFDQTPSSSADGFDVDNKYGNDDGTHNTVEEDATVAHDDMTYDGC